MDKYYVNQRFPNVFRGYGKRSALHKIWRKKTGFY